MTMEKKIGRTFAEATAEYEKEHGSLEGFHRDIDEVLSDKSLADAFDAVMKADPEGEREFWQSAYEHNLEDYGPDDQWVKNLKEALDTGKFPPKPVR